MKQKTSIKLSLSAARKKIKTLDKIKDKNKIVKIIDINFPTYAERIKKELNLI